jgi:hypothetical protein
MKSSGDTFFTDEKSILEELCTDQDLFFMATLSEVLAPRLGLGWNDRHRGFDLVIGDAAADRIAFWNLHQKQPPSFLGSLSGLRVSEKYLEANISLIAKLINARYHDWEHGQLPIVLHSVSLEASRLEELKNELNRVERAFSIGISSLQSHADVLPKFEDPLPVHWEMPQFNGPIGAATEEISEGRFALPHALPAFLRDWAPPPILRTGIWMLDLTIERELDHGKFVNVVQPWTFPRRIRIDKAIEFEFDREDQYQSYAPCIRPLSDAGLTIALSHSIRSATVTMPIDQDAFRAAVCLDYQWEPFDRSNKDSKTGFQRFAYSEFGDKGRYLIGILGLFATLPNAYNALLHPFWHKQLATLGAVSVERNVTLQQQLLNRLRRLKGVQEEADLVFSGREEQQRLARVAFKSARELAREWRYISYEKLRRDWEAAAQEELAKLNEEDWDFAKSPMKPSLGELDGWIKYLCGARVLFQGREWRCSHCYNKNWVGIADMDTTLTCAVCREEESAPVSGGWHFRANPFVLDAYRDHGIEPVIAMLHNLAEQTRKSFYFCPSLALWVRPPQSADDKPDVEIDALAVVDGQVFMCEAKTSSGLDRTEVDQLALAARYIRPDVVLLAFADDDVEKAVGSAKAMSAKLPDSIAVRTVNRSQRVAIFETYLSPAK